MSAAPRFSLVIPTRNRAGLLRGALATATAQDRDDLEIVVSDNASADDTLAITQESADPRVRYVRSDVPLSQPDSWQFGIDHSQGDYVTVLGDDDGVVPSLFDRVDEVIRAMSANVVAWNEAWYTHGEFPPPGLAPGEENVLTVEPTSGAVTEVACAEQLTRFFARREVRPVPAVVNSAISREVLYRIRGRAGHLFASPDPAVASITGVFVVEPSYVAIDQPLGLKGLSGATLSIGLFHADRTLHESISEFDTDALFTLVPLQSRTGTNLVAESLLRLKGVYGEELRHHALDLSRYFATTHREISDARRPGDGGAALDEWRVALAGQPAAVRGAVRSELRRHRAVSAARAAARGVPGVGALRRRLRPAIDVISGASHDFADLPGAARHLDRLLVQPAVSA